MLVPLDHAETELLREILEIEVGELRHEIHYTDTSDYKEVLKERLASIERLLGKMERAAQDVRS